MIVVDDDYLQVKTILGLSHDCVLIYDNDGRIELVNSIAKEIFKGVDEIVDGCISDFIGDAYLPKNYININNGEDLIVDKMPISINQLNEQQSCLLSIATMKIQSAAGNKRRYCAFIKEVNLHKVTNRVIITDNSNKSDSLSKVLPNLNYILDGIVEASPDAAFIITKQGTVKSVNALAINQLGYHKTNEFLGKNLIQMISKSKKNEDLFSISEDEENLTKKDLLRKIIKIEAVARDGRQFFSELNVIELRNIPEE